MSKAKWFVLFLLALTLAVPAQAVELTLGGFPSFMRTRYRLIDGATFISALSNSQARDVGFQSNRDFIFFADTTLRLTPQLVLSDQVTIRAQLNVFDNNIWGGAQSGFFGGRNTVINSNLSFSDRFRGAILTGPLAVDDPGFFDVRMLHADIVLPNNLGFLRVGRQPFDWGLGILANGGWDPYSDLGFVLDRFLWLKSFAAGQGSLTLILVADILSQGNSMVAGNGGGYDPGAIAIVWNNPNVAGTNLTIGGYFFPWFFQNGIGSVPGSAVGAGPPAPGSVSSDIDLDRLTLWSGLIDVKTDTWRLVGEMQGWQGEFNSSGVPGFDDLTISTSWLFAARAEVYPGWPAKLIAAEFGWAQGGDGNLNNNEIRGNEGGMFFNPAFNIDNLLFKHMLPNIYQQEGSVINAYYARLWSTIKIVDSISFTPQVIVAFNENTDNVLVNGPLDAANVGVAESIDTYLGTEVEATITWHIHPGVSFDLIGGLVIPGGGLEDLLEAQAETVLAINDVEGNVNYDETPWTIQGRLMIFIDQFFK